MSYLNKSVKRNANTSCVVHEYVPMGYTFWMTCRNVREGKSLIRNAPE